MGGIIGPRGSLMDIRDYAIVGALAASISSFVGLLKFWTGYSDRVTEAKGIAVNALQEAAEAKNDHDALREKVDELTRTHGDLIDRRSREIGDSLAAIRQKITDVELWNRDNFVKRDDFALAMKELKDSNMRLEKLVADVRDRLPRRHTPAPGSD